MVKTYLNYEHQQTFSSGMLNNCEHSQVIRTDKLGKVILTAAQEQLVVCKAGSCDEVLRVSPFSKQESAKLTCFRAFVLDTGLKNICDAEVSDGEGIDDPFGFFDEKDPLHMTQRKRNLVLAPESKYVLV